MLVGLAIAIPAILVFPDLMLVLKARPAPNLWEARQMLSIYASFAALLIPVVLWAAWRLGGRHWAWMSAVVTLGLLTLIWLTYSRASLAGLLAAIAATIFTLAFGNTRKGYIVGLAALFVALGAAVVGNLEIDPEFFDYVQVNGFQHFLPPWLIDPHRQLMWQHTIGLALERPCLGFGINTINLQDFSEARLKMDIDDASLLLPGHPHNWIVEAFSETGIVGTVPLLVTVSVLFVTLLRNFLATGRPEPLVGIAVSAAFWVSGLFNFSFWSAW